MKRERKEKVLRTETEIKGPIPHPSKFSALHSPRGEDGGEEGLKTSRKHQEKIHWSDRSDHSSSSSEIKLSRLGWRDDTREGVIDSQDSGEGLWADAVPVLFVPTHALNKKAGMMRVIPWEMEIQKLIRAAKNNKRGEVSIKLDPVTDTSGN